MLIQIKLSKAQALPIILDKSYCFHSYNLKLKMDDSQDIAVDHLLCHEVNFITENTKHKFVRICLYILVCKNSSGKEILAWVNTKLSSHELFFH